jgi:CubicO group peptidase (beta-lactamase class C family)
VEPPPGQKADPRLNDVTVQHLLNHQGGWDREATFDPLFHTAGIAAKLGKPFPLTNEDVTRFMVGQPLQFTPGSKTAYSNFGYCVLGRVIEKVTGQSYLEHIRKEVLAPAGIKGMNLGRTLPRDRDPREPWYADAGRGRNLFPGDPKEVPAPDGAFSLELLDAAAGLIGSAGDVARFAKSYRLTGEPAANPGVYSWHTGSLPGTFALAVQRPDGVILVALCNQKNDRSGLDYEALRGILDQVVEGIERWPVGEEF